jgi:outer membrane biosynthesis protein TonB
MVRSASPFPAIPPGLGRNSMSFAAPIRFNLR